MRKKGKRTESTRPKKDQNLSASSELASRQDAPQDAVEAIPASPDEETPLEIHRVETYSGPLPTPADFENYNRVVPGAAERILGMAEREQQIRADNQAKILTNDTKRIHGATLLGVGLLVIAGIAAWQGAALIALPLGLAGVISVVLRQLFARLDARAKPKE